jgi:orotidine-5'-phosphate decarboxylase
MEQSLVLTLQFSRLTLIVSDFGEETVAGFKPLSSKHNFMIFEDRKFVDIGNTVQKQYDGGVLQISEWAHVVNVSIHAGTASLKP